VRLLKKSVFFRGHFADGGKVPEGPFLLRPRLAGAGKRWFQGGNFLGFQDFFQKEPAGLGPSTAAAAPSRALGRLLARYHVRFRATGLGETGGARGTWGWDGDL